MEKEKEKALRLLLGDETANLVLAQVQAKEKSIESVGVKSKEVDLSKMSADDLLDYAIAKKEAEMEAAEKMDGEEGDEARADETVPVGQAEFKQLLEAINGLRDDLKGMMGTQSKEADAAAQKESANQARAVRLEKQIGALQTQLKELQGEQPRAKQPGYRPSRDADPVPDKEAEALKQASADGVNLITQRVFGANGA